MKKIKSFTIEEETCNQLRDYAELSNMSLSASVDKILTNFFDAYFKSNEENKAARYMRDYTKDEKDEILLKLIREKDGNEKKIETEIKLYRHIKQKDLNELIQQKKVRYFPRFHTYEIDNRDESQRSRDKVFEHVFDNHLKDLFDQGILTKEQYEEAKTN